jgi:hypothetical protein
VKGTPTTTGACCPKSSADVTQLPLDDAGRTVGIRRLDAVFERLLALGRTPDQLADAELVERVRAERNFIPSMRDVEELYATALRRAYAAYLARRAEA